MPSDPPEPICVKLPVRGDEADSVEVDTPKAKPPADDEYSSKFPAEIGEDVESPVPPPPLPVIVTGDEPRIVNVEHETVPEHEALVVAAEVS